MLQWMGGSRRKVATSRKSTQKRQKHYFEQRKRQQQQTAGQESYSENTGTCSPHPESNRSLDILSLLNLSTIGQECNPSCPSARGKSEGDFLTLNYEPESCPTTTQMETIEVYPAAPTELKDIRTSSSIQGEKVCPKKKSFDSSASHTKALKENSVKVDNFKIATDRNLSVLELLGDDGQDNTSDASLMHESHVAFSVEGLGEVELETPVHSPHQPVRSSFHDCMPSHMVPKYIKGLCQTFNYGCSPRVRPTKRVHSSKNLDCWLDDLEPELGLATSTRETGLFDLMYKESDDLLCDVDTPFHESPPELPLSHRDMIEPFCDPNQKLRSNKDFLHHNLSPNYTRSYFDNEEILYACEDEDEYRWKARHSVLDENFLDQECDLSWNNWPCDFDSTTAGNLNTSNWGMPDFSFESFHMQKRRPDPKAARRFNISDSYAPRIKQNIPENYCDFIAPEMTRCPAVGRTFNVRDVTDQPAWPSFMTDDAKDTPSLLSEESCSSSAVWHEATKNSHNPMPRQKMRAHAGECISPTYSRSLKSDICAQEHGKSKDSPQQQDSINGQGKSSRMSNSSPSTPAHKANTNFPINGGERRSLVIARVVRKDS